jgi:hypothetical protein
MLVRNLQKKGDLQRAYLVQEENLALAIANEQNISSARKNLKAGLIPQLTEKQLRSREEMVMDGATAMNRVKNNLLTIFTPDQVSSFMTGMSEDVAGFINIYFQDLKKEFETKTNLTKTYFDKIIEVFMNRLEKKIGTSNEKVNIQAESSAINDIVEMKKLIPERIFIREIIKNLVSLGQQDAAMKYANLYFMLPSDIILQKISQQSSTEQERILSELQKLLRGVNPDNKYWSAISRSGDLQMIMDALPEQSNMDRIIAIYEMVEPNYRMMIRREGADLLTLSERRKQILKPEPSELPVFAGYTMQDPLTGTVMTPIRSPPMRRPRAVVSEPTVAEEATLGFAGFGQPQGVVQSTLQRTLQRKRSGERAEEPVANLFKAFTGRPAPVKKGVKSGKGIAPKPLLYHDFGKFLINGNALDNQMLQVRYQAGGSIPGFGKKIALSDTLQDVLKTLIDTGKLNKSQFKELDDTEKRLLETLMIKSGIGADYGIKTVTPTDDLKKKMDRYEVLIGNFNAGNNAIEVIHEIRSLILYFMKIGQISKREAIATLMDLQ